MATFCLLHSSVQGPSCWNNVARGLRERGHQAITPDLGNVNPESTARVYAKQVAEVITDEIVSPKDDLWVLAHSATGMFLPWIAREVDHLTLRGVIYLAAYVPTSGESLISTLQSDNSMFNPGWLGSNPLNDVIAEEFLFHDCRKRDVAEALLTRRLMLASVSMSETFPDDLEHPHSEYIICKQDRTLTPNWMRRAARDRLDVTALEIDSGHCPQTSVPVALTAILSMIATTKWPPEPYAI